MASPLPDGARRTALCGALLALTGVAAGALGAHALRDRLAPALLATFETAVRYQLFHALALFAAAWLQQSVPGRLAGTGAALLGTGALLFSGSLYLIVLGIGAGIGWVTPVGGLLLLSGWACLVLALLRRPSVGKRT
jgi:uncharacterized membrane protein YgdD (TMEM256/DUF423 family)